MIHEPAALAAATLPVRRVERPITRLVVHAADTYASMDIGVEEIRRWHLERDFSDVGYHRVIRRDGTVENGRNDELPGAHAYGFNADSLAVCLVGGKGDDGRPECNFTRKQLVSLRGVLYAWSKAYPDAVICGHNELTDAKACPTFSVPIWAKTGDVVPVKGARLALV